MKQRRGLAEVWSRYSRSPHGQAGPGLYTVPVLIGVRSVDTWKCVTSEN